MRRAQTPHEQLLWARLRDRRFVDYKFRRQVPIGPYIADFVCLSERLIIELDGSQHAGSTQDEVRDAWLKSERFRVLRIWNNQLASDSTAVLDAIWHALQEQHA